MKTRNQKLETRNFECGFTLIEVMMAVALTVIIVVAAAGLWISCTRGWKFAQETQQTVEEDELVTGRIRQLFERSMIESSSRDLYQWKCDHNFDGRLPSDKIQFTTQWPEEDADGKTILVPI